MPRCKNNNKRSYKGTEPSPKGLGFCASGAKVGQRKKGKDDNMWQVKKFGKVQRWVKCVTKKHMKPKKRPEFTLLKHINPRDLSGSHKVGEVDIAPSSLVSTFGSPPSKSDQEKTSGEYVFRHLSGQLFTLYDWKMTTLYHPDAYTPSQFWKLDQKVPFMIGAKESSSILVTPTTTQKKTTTTNLNKFKKWLTKKLKKPIPPKKETVIFNMVFKWAKFEETPCKQPSNTEMCRFFRSKWTKTFLDHYCQMMGVWNEDVEPMYVFDKVVDMKHARIDECVIKKDCVHLEVQADLKRYTPNDNRKVVKLTAKNLSKFSRCLKDVFNFSIMAGGFLSKRYPNKEQGELRAHEIKPQDWTQIGK